MKQLTLSILLFYCLTMVGQNDHLEPIRDTSKYQGQLKVYYDGVFKLLLRGLSKKPVARYIALPSWGAEYVLSLEKDTGINFKMIVHSTSENYWYAKNKRKVKVKAIQKSIDTNFAMEIKRLFNKVTEQIKQPTGITLGADGTTYYFTAMDTTGQLITGKKWSPANGSQMQRLVQICEDLIAFTYGKGQSEIEIKENISRLLLELK